ncbi:uncharacterized protein N7503_003168 [Penicillium pulvis]|uniref:uncharacterized protein n=1 Tax=Penicillium pulvis TaxID=1562058 RepID=UPI0025492F4D|nr:uncharacterized protein N7503_003168 [Penicillium pulvis]KAJ5805566.1 hypothetical protein N7503_003168 [Penicillium pulvis]
MKAEPSPGRISCSRTPNGAVIFITPINCRRTIPGGIAARGVTVLPGPAPEAPEAPPAPGLVGSGVELRIGGVGDGSRGDELGLAGLAVEVAVRLMEYPDGPVPADELGQLLTVTVVVETGHAAHSPLARGQISALEAAAAREEEDTSFLPPLAGVEARQELDTFVMTAVVVTSRPSKSAKSRTAIIPCAPTGTVPKNTQEAANKAKQLFAYIPGMIEWGSIQKRIPEEGTLDLS